MKSDPVSGVQPELLKWARKTVGLSVIEVAETLNRTPEEIEGWEKGKNSPTYSQLEKLAYQVYKRPLALFFLPIPPEEIQPQKEFRTLPDVDFQELSKDTYLHIRKAHAYQYALKELFGESNPSERCIWKTISLTLSNSIVEQALAIRDYFGITMQEQSRWKDDETALKWWRKALEDTGIFIFKSSFKQKEISGFCLIDSELPIIYLNNSTTKTRQTFSLFHELSHLLFNINGLSKFETSYISRLPKKEKQLETFCNAIAAEILIPSADFNQQTKTLPENAEKASDDQFSQLANRYGVSREAVLRKLLDMGRVGKTFYESKAKFWTEQMVKKGGHGNWYLNQGAYLSDRFTKEVVGRHYNQQISLEHAADLLGIKPKNYAGFEERIMQGASA
ncbi:MAG TPA: XRE family transcriptional regulator [Holophaga sp.]|nr:XRE family transcriptional regulator [Holophaga sp.]